MQKYNDRYDKMIKIFEEYADLPKFYKLEESVLPTKKTTYPSWLITSKYLTDKFFELIEIGDKLESSYGEQIVVEKNKLGYNQIINGRTNKIEMVYPCRIIL